jgi:hypothetical protein
MLLINHVSRNSSSKAGVVIMALFQKIKVEDKKSDELPQYVDSLLENSNHSSNEEIDERFSVENMALKSSYGIDHAVALMRDLPADNQEIVVSVVTRTLESANIDVAKIIQDANAKELALESQINNLNEEIKSLQEQIAEKKEQINVSTAILDETRKVRGMLESSSGSEKKHRETVKVRGKKSEVENISEMEAIELALEAR